MVKKLSMEFALTIPRALAALARKASFTLKWRHTASGRVGWLMSMTAKNDYPAAWTQLMADWDRLELARQAAADSPASPETAARLEEIKAQQAALKTQMDGLVRTARETRMPISGRLDVALIGIKR